MPRKKPAGNRAGKASGGPNPLAIADAPPSGFVAVAGDDAGYAAHREKMAAASRDKSEKGREIGPPEPPKDPVRKQACGESFKLFCETYLGDKFPLGWSANHLKVIGKIEAAVRRGGQFAFAMPRKSGKTTLCEAAALWALLYGYRKLVAFIGASLESAVESFDTIREEVETNDLLDEDFREVTKYVRALEGIASRANAQTADGKRTRIEWSDKLVRFPTIDGSVCSKGMAKAVGITGRIRGMKIAGRRPDMAILDDPQTDETAQSLASNNKIERTLNGAVLGLAGQKRKIACFCPCTVICPGDMADRLLNRDRNPDWQGERMRMMNRFPERTDLWDEYAQIRADGLRAEDGGRAANEFYLANRAEMDRGAEVAWPDQYDEDEHSGIQHAMNLLYRNRAAFMAEYQNDPDPLVAGLDDLDAEKIAAKVNGVPRGVVPAACTRLTAFIDCGKSILFWCVTGWTEDFSGSVVDYGTFPEQRLPYFAATDARPGLADLPEMGPLNEDARVYAGLRAAVAVVVGRSYPRADGRAAMAIDRCLVDSGSWAKTVSQFCAASPYRGALAPSKGWGMGSGKVPMASWPVRPGERKPGDHWRDRPNSEGVGRLVTFDANHWKSFVARALLSSPRSAGCLDLFGTDAGEHRLFADHLTAEYRSASMKAKSGDQTEQELWSMRPDRTDNHWFDALVGAAVAASHAGTDWNPAVAAGELPTVKAERKKIKMSDIYAAKHGGRR